MDLARGAGVRDAGTVAAVFDAARDGESAALAIVETIAARLAHVIAAVSAVLDPELIVLGGGIGTGAAPLLIEPTTRTLATISPFRPRLAVSELGAGVVLDGAVTEGLRLVMDQIFGADANAARSVS
jgi:predicted NBD/HSP70 family sugar kinase